MGRKTPVDYQATIINAMEEHEKPIEPNAVIEFLQNNMRVLGVDTNDIEKFREILGPNFLNLTEETLTRKTGTFNLKHRKADNITTVVYALNLLREAEKLLKRLGSQLHISIIRNTLRSNTTTEIGPVYKWLKRIKRENPSRQLKHLVSI
ncbi:hypothetical protein C1646_669110 [Rhizophagus diaphanus]|nr:hypothetical protein C1646_669110 [Rhizophagus diaphanus] [Rhizophagus sp. MUCL 43196]